MKLMTGYQTELPYLLKALVREKSVLFYHPNHFQFLYNSLLPLLSKRFFQTDPSINIWHVGCSSGEDTYSLGITLAEFAESHRLENGLVLGTDFFSETVETARMGVFAEQQLKHIPYGLKKKYFLRSRNPDSSEVKITPLLNNVVKFRTLNFTDRFCFRETMHLVFCRDILQYLRPEIQHQAVQSISTHLTAGGLFFTGQALTCSLPACLEKMNTGLYLKK